MKIAILIKSLSNLNYYSAIIAPMSTFQDYTMTYRDFITVLMEEPKELQPNELPIVINPAELQGKPTLVLWKVIVGDIYDKVRCYKCGGINHNKVNYGSKRKALSALKMSEKLKPHRNEDNPDTNSCMALEWTTVKYQRVKHTETMNYVTRKRSVGKDHSGQRGVRKRELWHRGA